MKLFAKSKLVKKLNLRRICVRLMILLIAFDYQIIAVAADTDYVGKKCYLNSLFVFNTRTNDVSSYSILDYTYAVSYPAPTDPVSNTPSTTYSSVRYDVVFPLMIRSASLPDGSYHVDFTQTYDFYYKYVNFSDSSYKGPFLIDISNIYVESPDDLTVLAYFDHITVSPDNTGYTGGAPILGEGSDYAKDLTIKIMGDVSFSSQFSHVFNVHIPVYGYYGGSGLLDFGTRHLNFCLGHHGGDASGYTFVAGDRRGENSVSGTIDSGREEDRSDAEQAGDDSKSFVEEALNLENKWEILWFPIKFSNQILGVFTGGTSSAAYDDAFNNVVGFSYDDDSGILVPVIDRSRAQARSGGTIISFPEFILPVLDVKIWDAYDFDLSMIKSSFPLLFDSIYVAISIIEVYWFVAFLRDKYEEVFG